MNRIPSQGTYQHGQQQRHKGTCRPD